MKTLVLGPGGREHAIVEGLLADPQVTEVAIAPGNAGIAATDGVQSHAVELTNPDEVVRLAGQLSPDLIVIGPEAPLAAGVSDALQDAGFTVFGPTQAAAQLESSKAFAKEVMETAGVATAGSVVATTVEEAEAGLAQMGAPYVVKDDGLAAGKGVVVTSDYTAALNHARACLSAPGSRIVIEEFLSGPEVSVFVIADGNPEDAVALSPAQDFKRINDGDAGPNTGGMGAYTPLDWLPEDFTEQVLDQVARPVLREMSNRGTPFSGVLYCGLVVTADGIKVIEFNTRFGDPETQPVLSRLQTPLGQLLHAAASGALADSQDATGQALVPLRFSDDYAVAVVLASPGYPQGPVQTGQVIAGLDASGQLAAMDPETRPRVLHAGTARAEDGSNFTTAGGRVLAVLGRGASLEKARAHAYAGIKTLELQGGNPGQYRRDIALAAAEGKIRIPAQGKDLPGWRHIYSGKIRDLYEPADTDPGTSDRVLVVATDKISAFDHILTPDIPEKGKILTQLSLWWFEKLAEVWAERGDVDPVPHHVISADPADLPAEVAGRAMIVKRLQMLPIECVARGYLTGSGLQEYREHGTLAEEPLTAADGEGEDPLVDGSRLIPARFTPSAKAEVGEHDENISFAEMAERVGLLRSERLREMTLQIYSTAEEIARASGIILADTKVEFGIDVSTGLITLGDEVLTPDSSRFWDAETYEPGKSQDSFDKQFVRDWLNGEAQAGRWDKAGGEQPPSLPEDIVAKTRERYLEAFRRLTGREFEA